MTTWHVEGKIGGALVLDTGYTKICSDCCKRYAEDRKLIGKARDVKMEFCPACVKRAEDSKTRPLFRILKGKEGEVK